MESSRRILFAEGPSLHRWFLLGRVRALPACTGNPALLYSPPRTRLCLPPLCVPSTLSLALVCRAPLVSGPGRAVCLV